MIWIFPMAGRGSRTRELGQFKPFIDINGRTMLGWLFRSIAGEIRPQDKMVFITTDEYARDFGVLDEIKEIINGEFLENEFDLITCPETPQGPSGSVYKAKDMINVEEPVIVVNCDQFIDFDMFEYQSDNQGFLPIYSNFTSKSSYVEIRDGKIVRVVEKQNISNLASAGVYSISSGKALVWALEKQFELKQLTNDEYYIGPALNNLIEQGYDFYPTLVRAKYDLGNVKGIESFKQTMFARETIN